MVHAAFWLVIALTIGTLALLKFLPIRFRGLGFARLSSLTFTLPKVATSSVPREWMSFDGPDFDRLFRFFGKVKFALQLRDLSISLDRSCFHLLLHLSRICISVNVYPEMEQAVSSSRSTWFLRMLVFLAKIGFQFAKIFLRIEVDRIEVVMNHLEPEKTKEATILNFLQFTLEKFQMFPGGSKIVQCDKLVGKTIIKEKAADSSKVPKELLLITDVCLNYSHEGLQFEVKELKARLYPINLIFLVSSFGRSETHQTQSMSAKGLDIKSLNTLLPGIHLVLIKFGHIEIKAIYPKSRREMDRFECLCIAANSVQIHGSVQIDSSEIALKTVLLCAETKVTAKGLHQPGHMMQSVVHRLFNVEMKGSSDDLFHVKEIFVSNCLSPDIQLKQPETLNLQSKYIDSCLHSNTPCNILSSDNSNPPGILRDNVIPLYQKFVHLKRNIFINEKMNVIQETILINTSSLVFQVPFEFPLSNFVDHLIFLIKGIQAPLCKKSDRQPINPFKYSWNIRVQAGLAALQIEDEQFERNLSKCFRLKRQLYNKIDRLDRRFWIQSREKIQEESKMSADDLRPESLRWITPVMRPLVEASGEPETLKSCPHLIKPYVMLHEKAFEMYRRLTEEHVNDHGKYLFDLQVKELDFSVAWKKDNVDDMSTLLNRIDREENISSQDIEEMGVLMGGFVDIFGKSFEIQLKDYSLPLVYSDLIHIAGLLFLLEEPSYPEALSHNLIEMSPFVGKWNIRGLDEFCRVPVKRTILPVKTYHSLCITVAALTDESPIIAGYSPLYEGTFQMLDRSFELFTKPSEELSPFLPFWDKMRLLLRGSNTLLNVNGPCQVVTIAGVELDSTSESTSLVFPSGFVFSMEGSDFKLKVPSAAIFLNTKEQALLVWLHKKFGFQSSDLKEIAFPAALAGDMLLVYFPEIEVLVRLEAMGLDGRKPAPHGTIKVCAATNEVRKPSADIDSYRFFRIHQLSLMIDIKTSDDELATSKLLVFYFREIEEWFQHKFMQFVMPPVRPGILFKFATLSRKATPKLSLVVNDARLKVDFKGVFCARGMQYFNTETFGGVLLHSSGRSKLMFCWRKSEQKQSNPNFNQWFQHLAEISFGKTKVAIITSEDDEDSRKAHLMAVNLPLNFGDATVYDVFEATRLFFFQLDHACFKYDPDAASIQKKLIESRLRELSVDIDIMAGKLRKMDPSVEVTKFAERRRKLGILIDQQSLMAKFVEPSTEEGDESRLIEYYQFIIQNARVIWHQAVRNSVFTMVDEQFQYFRCTQALKDLEILFKKGERGLSSETILRDIHSPLKDASPLGPQAEAKQFLDDLLLHSEGPILADPEDDTDNGGREKEKERELLHCDPAELGKFGMQITARIDFEMTFPQLVLMDAYRDEMQAAIILNAQSASLQYGTVQMEELGPIVGRRTKVTLEKAKLYTAFRNSFPSDNWPPVFPIEYLLSRETETRGFQRMSDKVRMTVVYDVSNKRLKYGSRLFSPIVNVFGHGDAVRVDADPLLLHTDTSQFSVLYDVIVNLLVYRDETQKIRSEQLESIILAANLLQKSDMLNTVLSMQKDLRQRYRRVQSILRKESISMEKEGHKLLKEYSEMKVRWDEVALVVDAMRTAQSNAKEQLKQRQTRLELTVVLPRIQWTMISDEEREPLPLCEMKMDGIHDNWISAPDGTQANLIEILSIKAINKTPDAFYKTLLAPIPEEVRKVFLAEGSGYRGVGTMGNAIRFYFKARPSVAGIKLIELVELNLSPMQIQITYEMVEEFIKFFFPPVKPPQTSNSSSPKQGISGQGDQAGLLSNIKNSIKSTASTFLSKLSTDDQIDDEDLSLMAARSADNCSFVYINVPASQHLISYKGRGEKSITDVENFTLRLPDFEYHSQIWSWLEFFLQLRRDTLKVLLSNLGALVKDKIKRLGVANIPESDDRQKFGWILSKSRSSSEDPEEENERKARMLLGKSYNPRKNGS